MKSRSFLSGLAAAAGMLVLILDARTGLEGMRSGMDICLNTLIPSLFPFFVLSIYLTGNLIGRNLAILRPICKLCGIPAGAESLLVTGFLGGYPVGAQSVAQAYEQRQLSKQKAQRLLGFCSNAGPAFLFGVIGQAFDSIRASWMLWFIHILSALLVGLVVKSPSDYEITNRQTDSISLTRSLRTAISVMAQVCGWVILFRMLLHYLDRWFLWVLPDSMQVMLSGILELSNGCLRLREMESEGARFVAASALTAFGGICVTLQTCSVTKGLSLKYYFSGKLLQTGLSILMASALSHQPLSPAVMTITCLISLFSVRCLRKKEKNSSIPVSIGV